MNTKRFTTSPDVCANLTFENSRERKFFDKCILNGFTNKSQQVLLQDLHYILHLEYLIILRTELYR